jgi:protein-S-isoprenylcysteine O-methyltransferase Ste14
MWSAAESCLETIVLSSAPELNLVIVGPHKLVNRTLSNGSMKKRAPLILSSLLVASVMLFMTGISPTYLVEGTSNRLGFEFKSKEHYATHVQIIRTIYAAGLLVSVALWVATLWQWLKLPSTKRVI